MPTILLFGSAVLIILVYRHSVLVRLFHQVQPVRVCRSFIECSWHRSWHMEVLLLCQMHLAALTVQQPFTWS